MYKSVYPVLGRLIIQANQCGLQTDTDRGGSRVAEDGQYDVMFLGTGMLGPGYTFLHMNFSLDKQKIQKSLLDQNQSE